MAAIVAEGAEAAPVVIATAKALLKKAAPYLKDAARFALETAGVSVVAAKSLNVTPQSAPIIIQALASDPNLATQAAQMLATVSADDGVRTLIASLGKSVASLVSNADSKVSTGSNVTSSDQLAKAQLIKQASGVLGSPQALILVLEACANVRVSDVNEYIQARAIFGR